jgi:dinuclear metal center YbgI/SA1388 family protein
MVTLVDLEAYCNLLLESARFEDYCPNGLQVEAGEEVRRLVTGVTASQTLIDAAVAAGADTLLVHHGYFWKGEAPGLRGIKGRRVRSLFRAGLSLLAYHLPLDAHPTLGNNCRLAEVLAFQDPAPTPDSRGLLWLGHLDPPLSLAGLATRVATALQRAPLVVAGSARPVRRIAWCSGAAQDLIEQAAALGADAFLSGEISERTVHQAHELGIHYLAAGHQIGRAHV